MDSWRRLSSKSSFKCSNICKKISFNSNSQIGLAIKGSWTNLNQYTIYYQGHKKYFSFNFLHKKCSERLRIVVNKNKQYIFSITLLTWFKFITFKPFHLNNRSDRISHNFKKIKIKSLCLSLFFPTTKSCVVLITGYRRWLQFL